MCIRDSMMIGKYVDHIPFHRQLEQFKRVGVHLPASPVNDWFKDVADLLRPLYFRLWELVMQTDYIQSVSYTHLMDNGSDTGNLFEGFIDCLSWLELGLGYGDDYLVLNSVSLLERSFPIVDRYGRFNCYLDRDEAGRRTLEALRKRYADKLAVSYTHLKESIKTLILTLWKRDDEPPTRAEEVALSNAVNLFLEKIRRDSSIKPSFNTFYEFIRDEYQDILKEKRTREKDFDVWGFLNVLEPYYKGGEYDYLLNSDKQLDLQSKRFIVFELDNIKDNKVLFPIVTIIIMETFINKMRKLKGIRKMILLEEAWKAISKEGMAEYLRYLFKTVRKFFGEAVVVTQEVEDIISSPIVKGTIINNSDCRILLDQRKYMNKFDEIQALLGLTDKERAQILSINMANNPSRKYKEVWIGLGGSQSAVYATEVSLEEYMCYTTEETEKLELMRLTEKLGGNIELAIRQLADSKRSQVKGIGIT